MNRLTTGGDPDPLPCPAYGGCVLFINEVVVVAGETAGDAG